MGRTNGKNSRGSITAAEQNANRTDLQITLQHYIDQIYDKAWNELYGNINYMFLDDGDANDFVIHQMNKGGEIINPSNSGDNKLNVDTLASKIEKSKLEDGLAYLQNTKPLELIRFMNNVAKDRQKLINYAIFYPGHTVKVRDLKNKPTDWAFDGNFWFMEKKFKHNGENLVAQISPQKLTKDMTSRRSTLSVWTNDNSFVQEFLLPVFNNFTFTSTAKTIRAADVILGENFK